MSKKPSILIALGGNALIQAGQKGLLKSNWPTLSQPWKLLLNFPKNYTVVITHGNGPHVGNLLLQQESCDSVAKMPLAVIGAMTQGQIGFLIETALTDALHRASASADFATLVTYVVVDGNDPGFKDPTKYVGPSLLKRKQNPRVILLKTLSLAKAGVV
jgi:Carbamate kinase